MNILYYSAPLILVIFSNTMYHLISKTTSTTVNPFTALVTLNTYTYLGLEDAVDELKRVEELENGRKEMEKLNGEGAVSKKMFRAI